MNSMKIFELEPNSVKHSSRLQRHIDRMTTPTSHSIGCWAIQEFLRIYEQLLNSADGRVVKASAQGAVDLRSIPSRVKSKTLK